MYYNSRNTGGLRDKERKGRRMWDGQNIICLDVEVATSPDDLATGWNDLAALGLSIGGYYDYQDQRVHWFDQHTLLATVEALVARQPLMISFNGIGFDFALMRALLRQRIRRGLDYQQVCDQFAALAAQSYDILAEIWAVAPENRFQQGNSLDALSQHNGLGAKTGHGAQAPRLWQAGRLAEVMNYCQQDILLTCRLAEHIASHHGLLPRPAGAIGIRHLCDAATAMPQLVTTCPVPVEETEDAAPFDLV